MSDSQEAEQTTSTVEKNRLAEINEPSEGCLGLEVCEEFGSPSEKDYLSPTVDESKLKAGPEETNVSPRASGPGKDAPLNKSPEKDKLANAEDKPLCKESPRESKRHSLKASKNEAEKVETEENEVKEKRAARADVVSKRSTRSITSTNNGNTELSKDEPSTPTNKVASPLGVALSKRARSTASVTPSYQDLHSLGRHEAENGAEEVSPRYSEKSKCYQTKTPTLIAHNKDYYCWICHESENLHACNMCFRVYHTECLESDPESAPFNIDVEKPNWECYECLAVEKCTRTSRCSTWLSIENLGMCLQKVVSRLANTPSFDLFSEAVDKSEYPDYTKFIYKPMHLGKMDKKAMTLQYACAESLRQDCKLFYHNSSIFNGPHSPITSSAKKMLTICDKELAQIEACPDCYCNSLLRSDFFETPCRIPHPLVWAKFGNYPYWPSKVFAVLYPSKKMDCRFFGAHDRANVPFNCVYKFSKDPPEPVTKHLKKFEVAIAEAERYVKKLQTYQSFKLAANKTKYLPPAQDEPFDEINEKIAAELKKQNEDSESVSSQILKQIDSSSGGGRSESKTSKKKSSKDDNEIVSTDDLSSDSESDSDSEMLLAKLSSGHKTSSKSNTTPVADAKNSISITSKSDAKKRISSNQNSSTRSKRVLGMSFTSQTDENANMTPIPPSKKPRNDTPMPSGTHSNRSKFKLELSNKKEIVANSPFSEESEGSKTPKEDKDNSSYNKTRSRRSLSPSKEKDETLADKKERSKGSKEKEVENEEEFVEDETPSPTEETDQFLQSLEASGKKESETSSGKNDILPQLSQTEVASSETETDQEKQNTGLFSNLSESMDTSPLSEETSDLSETNQITSTGSEVKTDQKTSFESQTTTTIEKLEDKKDVVQVTTDSTAKSEEPMDCAPIHDEPPNASIEEKPKDEVKQEKPKKEQSRIDESKPQTIKAEVALAPTQSESQSLPSTNSKKPSFESVLLELEETGRGKRTKIKNSLYNSDEEVDPRQFTKSSVAKKAKESKETVSSSNGSSLAATLQAKRLATLTPKSEANTSLSPSTKPTGMAFQRSVSHGSPAVKPVILSESNKMHCKPKGVVKGTPQPTPPKTAPGPSSEDALVDKVTERLSGSLGDLVKQVLEAQSRGDTLSKEDIINAIMNRTSLAPSNKMGSIAPPVPSDGFFSSIPPIKKKVETRDSPAQVDLPNEMAATQRAELRKLASEKKAALDERQKLIDEIAAWQRKVKNMKEAEVERREIHGNKLRQEFSAKVDEFKREKNLQLNDLTRHYELLMAEIDSNLSSSHREEVRKLKEQHANDLKEVKRKQWCAYCLKESQYHCCWNTSYCDYRCQQKHWSEHMKTCTQKSRNSAKKAASSSQSSSSENSKGRPSPMPSPSASPASTTSSSLPMNMFTPASVSGLTNGPAVPCSSNVALSVAGIHGAPPHMSTNPQMQPVATIAPNSIPQGAQFVTLPPGTLPPPGSVPMMFNPNVQQPPNVLPFNAAAMMQMGPPPVSVMPGSSMGAP